MGLEGAILSAAQRRFEQERDSRQRALEQRRQQVYQRLPRVEEIDRQLRGTVAQIMLTALRNDTDPEEALRRLERENRALQEERSRLLAQAGVAPDCLDDTPLCRICEDRGFLRDGTPCRCLMRYYAREQNRRLSKLLDLGNQSFVTFSLDWYSDLPYGREGVSPRKNMQTIFSICQHFARRFGAGSDNLLLTGEPGLGKTFLSACIAREVSERGFSVVYDTAAHIFQQLEREKFGREGDEESGLDVDRYLRCDLLIMDDLGTEMTTSFVQSAFYRIVNERLMTHRSTVLSTNLTSAELGNRYGGAVQSRILGEYQMLRLFGEDIRLLRRAKLDG